MHVLVRATKSIVRNKAKTLIMFLTMTVLGIFVTGSIVIKDASENVRDRFMKKADLFHTQYLTQTEDFLEIGLRYVRFAHEERNLFRFLFQSGRFDGKNLREMIRGENVQQLIASAASELEMNREQAADAFEALFAMVHGYGALVADNALEYD